MGKKKTLKHKKITDVRKQQNVSHEVSASHPHSHTLSYSFSPLTRHHTAPVVQQTVITDVRKTALISLTIIALEILLFTLLQNHVLALPFVRY